MTAVARPRASAASVLYDPPFYVEQTLDWVTRENPLFYGAVGDGSDENDAVQAALSAASATGGSGIVHIPNVNGDGEQVVFGVTGLVPPASRVRFSGVNAGTYSEGSMNRRSILRLVDGANDHLITAPNTVKSLEFDRIWLDGNKDGQSIETNCIELEPIVGSGGDTWFRMYRCNVSGFSGNGVHAGSQRGAGRLVDTTIYDCKNGVVLRGPDWLVHGCAIGGMVEDGIQSRNWTTKVIGCDVFNCRVGLQAFDVVSKLLAVIGNMFDQNRYSGLWLGGVSGTVVGNGFHGNSLEGEGLYPHINVVKSGYSLSANDFGESSGATPNQANYDILIASGESAVVVGNTRVPGSAISGHVGGAGLRLNSIDGFI